MNKKFYVSELIILLILTNINMGESHIDNNPCNNDIKEIGVSFSGGNGTIKNPYQIEDVFQLKNISLDVNAYYILVNDINASNTKNWDGGKGFLPIGNKSNPFTGELNGNHFNISNLFIKRLSEDCIGLFSYTSSDASIVNLHIENMNHYGSYYVGGLIGQNKGYAVNNTCHGSVYGKSSVGGLIGENKGSVINCSVDINIENNNCWSTGGLIGINPDGIIDRCNVKCKIISTDVIGGLVGTAVGDSPISNCYVEGNITGYSDIGLLIGRNYCFISNCTTKGRVYGYTNVAGFIGNNYGNVSCCSSKGVIYGKSDVGGMIGKSFKNNLSNCTVNSTVNGEATVGGLYGSNLMGSISNSVVSGSVFGSGDAVGGLIGTCTEGTIKNCSTDVDVVGNKSNVGGLIGRNSDSFVSGCHALGDVKGEKNVSGLVGYNKGIIERCYSASNVEGNEQVGGLIGKNNFQVSHCHASGKIYGMKNTGGLIGQSTNIVEDCYSRCDVTGKFVVGGLIGENKGYTSRSYFNGVISGTRYVGGLIGMNREEGKCENSVYCINRTTINGKKHITPYGIYEEQFERWLDLNKTLFINEYLKTYSETDYYQISTIEDLKSSLYFAAYSNSEFIQVSDIDLSSEQGFYLPVFNAKSYNGNGYCLKNMNLSGYVNNNLGFFGYLGLNVEIKKLSLKNVFVRGWDNIGGLVGNNYQGLVTECFVSGSVEGNSSVGGLLGHHQYVVKNCYSTAKVFGADNVGGLVGFIHGGIISSCYSIGSVSGEDSIGGLVAAYYHGTISGSFWDVQTSNTTLSKGGDGKKTSEMKNRTIYNRKGWDFKDIWNLIDGASYPFLRTFDYGTPKIITNDIETSYEDELYEVDYDAISYLPGGKGAFWKLRSNAQWLTMEESGLLSGSPDNTDVGDYWVNVSATVNHEGFDSTNFTLRVINVNDEPVIQDISIPNAVEDQLFFIVIECNDPDNDQLVWSMETNSSFLSIDSDTGNLSGVPSNRDVGKWWVMINVSDGNRGYDEADFEIMVLNTNDDPMITTQGIPDVYEDEDFSFSISAEDVDPTEDNLSWEMDSNGDFIHLDPATGTVTGKPTNEDVGKWWLKLIVLDGNGGMDTYNYTFSVINTNDRPEINMTDPVFEMDEDGRMDLDLNDIFFDVDNDTLSYTISKVNNLTISIEKNVATVTPENNWSGNRIINITASDGYLTVSVSINIIVNQVNDAPYDLQIIGNSKYVEGGNQIVKAVVKDTDIKYGDNLTFTWETDNMGVIGKGQVINLSLPSGKYIISLTVTDSEGLSVNASKNITIESMDDENGDRKIFSFLFIFVSIFLILIFGIIIIMVLLKKKGKDKKVEKENNNEIDQKSSLGSDSENQSKEDGFNYLP